MSLRALDAKGRPKYEHHIRLHDWLVGPLLELCSGNEIKGLIFIARFDFGDNNGRIHMSERRMSEGIGVDRKTARKILAGLENKGFIACTAKGSFNAKRSPASQWRLTWKAWPDQSQGPTHEYRRILREKDRGESFPRTGGVFPVYQVRRNVTGEGSPPGDDQEAQKSAEVHPVKNGPPTLAIASTLPAVRAWLSAWWRMATPKDRLRMAAEHGLPISDVIDFIQGTDLPSRQLERVRETFLNLPNHEAGAGRALRGLAPCKRAVT